MLGCLDKNKLTNALGERLKVCLEIRHEHGWTYWSEILCLLGVHKGDRVLTKFSLEE